VSKAPHVATALVVLACVVAIPSTGAASAIPVEVARNCDAATYKAFPPRVVGNPAAGSARGTGRSEQRYFMRCVAKAKQHHE